jgi:hypothetical protein
VGSSRPRIPRSSSGPTEPRTPGSADPVLSGVPADQPRCTLAAARPQLCVGIRNNGTRAVAYPYAEQSAAVRVADLVSGRARGQRPSVARRGRREGRIRGEDSTLTSIST